MAVAAARSPVAIVGAGPYGLSVAGHLNAEGIETRVFGRVMEFWKTRMPRGMFLRSAWEASHIADPKHALTLDAYQVVRGPTIPVPIPLDTYIEYGNWFQAQLVPDVDPRNVVRIERRSESFRVVLEDRESLDFGRVVIAAGLAAFSFRPPQFESLPPTRVSHASDERDLARFAGNRVLVVGGGQSALECAALMHESGAEVEVVARANEIHWLRGAWLRSHLGPLRPLVYPSTDVGPPGLNWIVGTPDLFRTLPPHLQTRIARRSIRPAGSGWLKDRVLGVPVTTGRTVLSARAYDNAVRAQLDDRSERVVDHILLGTGYRVDVSRYSFLTRDVARAIRHRNGCPELTAGFESSVPGLHFVGAPAEASFGPIMRFVSGTRYAAPRVVQRIVGRVHAPGT